MAEEVARFQPDHNDAAIDLRAALEHSLIDGSEPLAGATNLGKVSRYQRPAELPLDPTMLDAHRDNDFETPWEPLSGREALSVLRAIGGVLIACAAVAYVASLAFGVFG